MNRNHHKFILIYFLFGLNLAVYSQDPVAFQNSSRAAQYYLGSDNELRIPVNIWGFVKNPGQYMVPNNTDLISLLSYAGGPLEGAKLNTIQIVRNNAKDGNQVWKIDVKKYIETADVKLIPVLKPGDTIVVKGTTFHWITKSLDFISKLLVFAQLYYLIAIAQNNK